jgi:hypothetical protein
MMFMELIGRQGRRHNLVLPVHFIRKKKSEFDTISVGRAGT